MTGAGGAKLLVPQYIDLGGYTNRAAISGKHKIDTFFKGRIAQKSPPRTPSDCLQQAWVQKDLLEYGLKFGENCSPLTKTAIKKHR
jgi:hypothetical protein